MYQIEFNKLSEANQQIVLAIQENENLSNEKIEVWRDETNLNVDVHIGKDVTVCLVA